VCNPAKSTLIVPSDTALVNFEVMTGREIGLNQYLSQNFWRETAVHLTTPPDKVVLLSSKPFTNLVDMQFCWRLALSTRVDLGRTTIRAANELRPQDLKGYNVILIGARRANPWVELFDQTNNFLGLHDSVGDYVLNRAPKGSERQYYRENGSPVPGEAYAVVSYLPGLNADDHVVIVSGTTSAGTEAALDYMLNPVLFGRTLNDMAGAGNAAPGFEILLRAGTVNFRSPGRAEVLTWRKHAR
jgi:hypothetical protein